MFKKILGFLITVLTPIIVVIIIFPDKAEFLRQLFFDRLHADEKTVQNLKNAYYVDEDFLSYKNIEIINPKNKQELQDSMRTIANSGVEDFGFYCDEKYESCLEDATNIFNEDTTGGFYIFRTFNHPFNDFTDVSISYNKFLKHLELEFVRKYSDEQIKETNEKIDEIYQNLYNPDKSVQENLKIFNDFIINNTIFDEEMLEGNSAYHSDSAYGVLFEGRGTCMGYTDTMYLFIEKLGLKQFRVTTASHTWNAVNIDGAWLHLDATWNDDVVQDRYFLITTEELLKLDTVSHNFDKSIYQELA